MPSIAIPPSRELKRLAGRLEWAMIQYAGARGLLATKSKWESLRHAWTLSNLTLRHAEATTLMARTDVAHAPTAWVTARAAVESAARCLWLLEPDDEWEREARWLACLREGARFGNRPQLAGVPGFVENSEILAAFAAAVEAKMPEGLVVPGVPSTDSMLTRIAPDLARFYVMASQFTHGAEFATRTFRSHLGDAAVYGESSDEFGWVVPLHRVWQAFQATAVRLIVLTDAGFPDLLDVVDGQLHESFEEFLDARVRQ